MTVSAANSTYQTQTYNSTKATPTTPPPKPDDDEGSVEVACFSNPSNPETLLNSLKTELARLFTFSVGSAEAAVGPQQEIDFNKIQKTFTNLGEGWLHLENEAFLLGFGEQPLIDYACILSLPNNKGMTSNEIIANMKILLKTDFYKKTMEEIQKKGYKPALKTGGSFPAEFKAKVDAFSILTIKFIDYCKKFNEGPSKEKNNRKFTEMYAFIENRLLTPIYGRDKVKQKMQELKQKANSNEQIETVIVKINKFAKSWETSSN
ncbi:MAG: hypothetical protein PHV30_07780, partial [Candidatus Margulisbacteria bacterium]|nr:hypothetical protein [Candidatus Margulisiibacteriota bacterium]